MQMLLNASSLKSFSQALSNPRTDCLRALFVVSLTEIEDAAKAQQHHQLLVLYLGATAWKER